MQRYQVNSDQKQIEQQDKEQINSSKEAIYKADVHVWNTTILAQEPGHVSLTLQKISSEKHKSRHFGFWPERELTACDAFSSLKAKVKKNLDEEIHYSPNEPAWHPNKQYDILLSKENYKDMKKEIDDYSKNIDSGHIQYTWLVPLKTGINNTLGYIYNNQNQLRLESCSTATTKILNKGNIPIKSGYAPWGITPSDVGNQLEKLITDKVIVGRLAHPVSTEETVATSSQRPKRPRENDVDMPHAKYRRTTPDTNLFDRPKEHTAQAIIKKDRQNMTEDDINQKQKALKNN